MLIPIRILLFVTIVNLFVFPSIAESPRDLTTHLQNTLDTWRTDHELVGVSLSIITESGKQLELVSGFANPETGRVLESNDPMYVGSIIKTFIATITLHLVDEGMLELDTTIEPWYPDYPYADSISIAQLLNMTSGTYDYFKNAPDNAFLPLVMADINRQWTANEIISAVAELEPVNNPGDGYTYSNTNYLMLGQMIEAITKQAIKQVLEKRIFEPLGLEASYLAGTTPHSTMLANGYLRDSAFLFGQEAPMVSEASHHQGLETVFGTAGGLVSTPKDLARFLHTLMKGNLLLSEAHKMAMLEPTEASLKETAGYGYGLEWFDTAQGKAVGHAGSIPGFASLTLHFPEFMTSISVATNDEQGEAALAHLIDVVITEVQDMASN